MWTWWRWRRPHGTLPNTCLPSGGSPCTASVFHHCIAPYTQHNAQLPTITIKLHSLSASSDMAYCSAPACHQVAPPALYLSIHHCMAAQMWHNAQLPTITTKFHCICHHCMAPQTWLIAQHLPAIRWVLLHCICHPSLHGSSHMAQCIITADHHT